MSVDIERYVEGRDTKLNDGKSILECSIINGQVGIVSRFIDPITGVAPDTASFEALNIDELKIQLAFHERKVTGLSALIADLEALT